MNQSAFRVLLSGAALIAALGTGLASAQSSATPPSASPGAPPAAATPGAPPGPGGPRGGHCGTDGPAGARGSGKHHGAMMNWLDTDADGQISRAELESANQARLAGELKAFDTADLNKDSKLSRNEMKAFRDAMRAEGGLGGRGCAPGGPGGSGAPGGRPPAPPAKPAA